MTTKLLPVACVPCGKIVHTADEITREECDACEQKYINRLCLWEDWLPEFNEPPPHWVRKEDYDED